MRERIIHHLGDDEERAGYNLSWVQYLLEL